MLHECIPNLMMYGEMSEWNKDAENVDEITIDNGLLEASDDQNVQDFIEASQTVELITSKIIL